MPAKSTAQRRIFGMVNAFKKGKLKLSSLGSSLGAKIKKIAKGITGKAAHDFAKGSEKGLPRHVKESDDLGLDFMSFKDYLIFEHALASELSPAELQHLDEAIGLNDDLSSLLEAKKKPSAGTSKAQRHRIAKKAKKGKNVYGGHFKDVERKAARKYGSKEAGEKVAAAAMWKKAAKEHRKHS